ncbi:putative auxin efflux carrier component 3-like [Capsicum annuum]|nr:putative auxin efflux carrier component 3-like [Capsicum annuum]
MKLYVGRGGLFSHIIGILKRLRNTLSQSSFDFQNGADSQASYDGPENTDYEGDFEHVNEIGHSARFVENNDRPTTLLENGKYQACENKGYAGHLELVNEVGHSAYFDENHDRSTHLSKNGKYQAENTGYDGDFERVNEVGDSASFEESFDGSNNGDIEVTECGREGSSNGDIEATERDGEDSIIFHSGHFNDPKPTIEVKEKLEGQDSSIEFSSNSVDLSSYAHITEKDGSVSSEPRRSSSLKVRTASQSRDTKSRMLSQVNVTSVKGTISNQAYKDMPRKPNRRHNDVSLTQKREKPRLDAPGTLLSPTARMPKPEDFASKTKSSKSQSRPSTAGARATSATENIVHCSRAEVYNRCFTNEHLNMADSPQVSKATDHPSVDSSVPSSSPTSKTSKQTQSN